MDFLRQFLTSERVYAVGQHALRMLIVLFAAWIVVKILRRWVPKMTHSMLRRMTRRSEQKESELAKRAETLTGIIRATLVVVTWTIALVMMLREAGFDIAPILAGAGIIGLAVGFGAQNLVRDVISGALMLLENQVRVGDVAVINGTGGLVERINLRTITLRGQDGTVHVFPNGTITTLSNMTHDFSYYVFNVGVAYKEDTDHVAKVLREIGAGMMAEEAFKEAILEPLEVLGVDEFADSAVIVKARIKTQPIKQWFVGREFNRRMKMKFDELGIEIPFPHLSLYFGEVSKPIGISWQNADEDKLRALVKEMITETQKSSNYQAQA